MVRHKRSHDPGAAWLVNGLAAIRAQIEELTRIETALAPVVRLLNGTAPIRKKSTKRIAPSISTAHILKILPRRVEFTTATIATMLRAKRSNVYTVLWRLQKQGAIEKTASGWKRVQHNG